MSDTQNMMHPTTSLTDQEQIELNLLGLQEQNQFSVEDDLDDAKLQFNNMLNHKGTNL